MGQRIIQVDAFTDRRFAGNPAAVCILPEPAEARWMQDVAAEMNLSETAFVVPTRRTARFHLRWFTPKTEVDLCGHATLATAHVLWEEGFLDPDEPARFETRSGLLTARLGPDGIELDFPSEPVEEGIASTDEERTLLRAPSRPASDSPAATGSISWSSSMARRKFVLSGRISVGWPSCRSAASS